MSSIELVNVTDGKTMTVYLDGGPHIFQDCCFCNRTVKHVPISWGRSTGDDGFGVNFLQFVGYCVECGKTTEYHPLDNMSLSVEFWDTEEFTLVDSSLAARAVYECLDVKNKNAEEYQRAHMCTDETLIPF